MTDNKQEQSGKLFESLFNCLLLFWFGFMMYAIFASSNIETIAYSRFLASVRGGEVDEVTIGKDQIEGKYKNTRNKPFRTYKVEDPQLSNTLLLQNVKFQAKPDETFGQQVFSGVMWVVVFLAVGHFLAMRLGTKEGLGTGLMSIEKSKAKVYMESNLKTTFEDVAGVDEAKQELQEVIGFLREPQRFNRLGGHLPKGILLVGPPGTGKTLLARAVAGEAGVPFFSISGSEFVEMFVGVGAARVRDLFAQAQKNAPCIIFIDELDALGRARSLNPNTGHDEKEQTLNQLLVELDGFDPRQGVVLLAASNRPEILDSALLRAGRFDRHILVDRPDKVGRAQILTVHLKTVVYDQDLAIDELAASTPGFTGADLANLVNEAVILATRRDANAVQKEDFSAALERVVAGLEKRNRLLNPHERMVVAYHEMGHALVAMALPGTDPIQKVSIIPRGVGALGYTIQRPTEDRFLMSREELEHKLTVLLGGRAAETIAFDSISTGAADDLSKATDIARSMVMRYGMIKPLGPVTYEREPSPYLNGYSSPGGDQNLFSEVTAREIDCAIRELINAALERALNIVGEYRSNLEDGARLLLLNETLTHEDLLSIFESRPNRRASQTAKQNEFPTLNSASVCEVASEV